MAKDSEDETLFTITEAAQWLGVSETAIRNARLEGRLPTVVKYGRKLVALSELQAYKDRTRPDGTKPKGRPARREASAA